jgi:hypothetical protein
MKCPKIFRFKLISAFLGITFIIFFSQFVTSIHALNIQNIEANIDLSMCGDGIAEFPEDCDGADLNQKNCNNLGYQNGDLFCDLGCEFDTASCSGVLVSPTPTSTPEPTASPQGSSSSTSTNTQSQGPSESQVNLVIELLRQIDAKLKLIQSRFDFDSSGKIEVYELYNTVKTWVEDWKINIEVETAYAKGEIIEEEVIRPEKCDLNNDNVCNVIDLSILLYYIER